MNRTHQLKLTLPHNIKLLPNVEFVMVNYNSSDDLDEYIKTIKCSNLTYVKTTTPKLYSMSKSRNMGFLAASNDIIASIDADNYLGTSDDEPLDIIINKMANQQDNDKCFFGKGLRLTHGQLAFHKSSFNNILGGYDNKFGERYGLEEKDLMLRAFEAGFTFYYWGGKYCNRLNNSGADRVANHEVKSIRESERINYEILKYNHDNKIIKVNV
jgi:glycosyltransferase involved in cell wall biosynthesis